MPSPSSPSPVRHRNQFPQTEGPSFFNTGHASPSASFPVAGLPSAIRTLSLETAQVHTATIVAVRKSAFSDASPLGARFSSGEHLAFVSKNNELPEQRFLRSWSVDSPTIYDFQGTPRRSPSSRVPSLDPGFARQMQSHLGLGDSNSQDARSSFYSNSKDASPPQSPSSFYDHYPQEGDTDFEDLQELHSPVPALADPRNKEFAGGNIPSENPSVSQTQVPDIFSQYEDYTTPIDPSPTEDPLLDLILAGGEERNSDETLHSPNSNPAMSLAIRKAPTLPHLILDDTTNSALNTAVSTKLDRTHEKSLLQPNPAEPTFSAPALVRQSSVDTTTSTGSLQSPLNVNKPLPREPAVEPKSPASASRIATFFGWASLGGTPTTTEFSDKGYSPLPSPFSSKPTVYTDDSPVSPKAPDTSATSKTSEITPRAVASRNNPTEDYENYIQAPVTPTLVSTPPLTQIDEMEDELKAISAELAASIRREMDLEDLVDRLQADISNPQGTGKRTSDYFSDSGVSSVKFSEFDQNREEVEKVQRKAEQEKAQLRLDLTSKLQGEREMRKELDQQIQELAAKVSQVDTVQINSAGANNRLKDLEKTCEDLRRRLSEEKQVKENFEDLLAVMKDELQSAANERDNLRDEIVPQLRARVEGLEAQAADSEKLAYETTKMQQELASLKQENSSLKHAQQQNEMRGLRSSVASRTSFGKLRSNSVTTAPPPLNLALPPITSLTRSLSVKNPNSESREAILERLKDVEAQRDALHNALKSLLDRQEFQNRENEKKIKALEGERDRLLASSPRKANYEKEVSSLRNEINVLRKRAEDAVEQRWQVEKGLGGLKMDLDRAEEEIASLRALLKEKDILLPQGLPRSSTTGESLTKSAVTSATLDKAYQDLKARYADALDRLNSLELAVPIKGDGQQNEKNQLALQRLQQSLANAISDRDNARIDAASLQAQLESLRNEEQAHLSSETELSTQLSTASNRIEELASQVSAQLAANASLRMRLSEAVARGEAAQKSDTMRITQMQARLRQLEDQLVAAQTAAEERVARHEEEIATLREGLANPDLHRRGSSVNLRVASPLLARTPRSPRSLGGRTPRSPNFPPMLSPRFPSRRSSARSAADKNDKDNASDDSPAQVETLKSRVAELEKALADTEEDMQDIVNRMSEAQIQVMTLQEEREAAIRETRKLQKTIEEEQEKAFEERFRNLASNAGLVKT